MAGHRPAHEALILSRGADFVHSWTIADLDPSGAAKSMTRLPGSYVAASPTVSGALWLNGYQISEGE